ncbi:hypothetical protein RvY_13306 [Ramazzottius varieornatus]|uniref:Uncharacterized protein n=1 Tax=Ramazzottius varieornatus TaxID=947166 RepID=A0A1D1VME0_RAMVA|nr:hypothetical protein RvY_13306 [Ramazzottius varieornatus]
MASGDAKPAYLPEETIKSLRVAKVFRDNTDQINGMDFSPHGDVFVTSSADESLTVYDVDKPGVKATVNSKKYGVEHVTFTRNNNLVIHGSTKVDNTIRLLSLKDNKYLRYFPGHTEPVVTLGTHPNEDQFLSSSMDGTVKLWDCGTSAAWGNIPVGAGRPVAAYDPEGLIVAIGVGSEEIRLHDIRKIGAQPFSTLKTRMNNSPPWASLKFSPTGTQILIATTGNTCYAVDAFMGNVIWTFSGYNNVLNNKTYTIQPCFSPDGKYVFHGSTDSRIHVYNTDSGNKVCTLKSDHTGAIQYTKFNPRYCMFASSCSMTCFWISTIPAGTPAPRLN